MVLLRTTPPCAPRCGAPCTWRSTPHRTCSTIRSACSSSRRTTDGATGRTCTRWAPAGSAHRSSPAPASSRIWFSTRRPQASRSTSCSAPAWTRSPSADPTSAERLRIFEVDQPGTQAWKRRRLIEVGFGVPDWLRLVPIDFETGESWWDGLRAAGFDPALPAVVASTGVSMYLTKDATATTLRQLATLAPGSTVVMTFLLPMDLVDEPDRPGLEMSSPRRPCRRHPVRQLLRARGDGRDGGRCRLRRCSPRPGVGARRAVLRRTVRRPTPFEW